MRGHALAGRAAARLAETEGADCFSDLVVVDLDDPGEILRATPATQRRYFEDHYAQLPFGLGTVRRRLDPDESLVTHPGAIAGIALALGGILAAASG